MEEKKDVVNLWKKSSSSKISHQLYYVYYHYTWRVN